VATVFDILDKTTPALIDDDSMRRWLKTLFLRRRGFPEAVTQFPCLSILGWNVDATVRADVTPTKIIREQGK
jgi:hypothetical protein